MNKLLIAGSLFFIFLIPLVSADANITTILITNGTINANQWFYADEININTNATGEVNLLLNGKPIKKLTMNKLIRYVTSAIDYMFGLIPRGNYWGLQLIEQLMRIFVTKDELSQILYPYEVRISALESALEKINQQAYCQGKIDTMLEMNLSWVKCGNTTYYNMDGKVIGITPG